MYMTKIRIGRSVLMCVGAMILIAYLLSHRGAITFPTFLTLYSPKGNYVIELIGRKERPFFFTNEVRLNVLKHGRLFVSKHYLHSGDAFDLSFESGYPDHRWVDENILHFYRAQNFNEAKADTLIVLNKTDKVINYVLIHSTDKILLLDIQAGSKKKLLISPPRGEINGLYAEGEFSEGKRFEKGVHLKIQDGRTGPLTHYLHVTDINLLIESHHLMPDPAVSQANQ